MALTDQYEICACIISLQARLQRCGQAVDHGRGHRLLLVDALVGMTGQQRQRDRFVAVGGQSVSDLYISKMEQIRVYRVSAAHLPRPLEGDRTLNVCECVVAVVHREIEMRVQIRSGALAVRKAGDFLAYMDALVRAMETLRKLEGGSVGKQRRWVEIYDGEDLRFSAEVSRSRRLSA